MQFTGMKNFSDISEQARKWVQPGRIFRSEDLSGLHAADWQKLQLLGIRSIIDLRTPNEQAAKPYRPPGTAWQVWSVPFLSEETDWTRWQFTRFLLTEGRRLDFAAYMQTFYHRLAWQRQAQIRAVFRLLAEECNWPVLIHCTGGKDRTGFIVALLQALAGVEPDVIMRSYLAVNAVLAPKMAQMQRLLRWLSLGSVSATRLQPLLEVRAEYLGGVLASIQARYDGWEDYLTRECGISALQLLAIRQQLCQPQCD